MGDSENEGGRLPLCARLVRLAPLVAAALAFAGAVACWQVRFLQDDAFISMRYARNLVAGHGLVFNPGEPAVEGYTNFLWTLLLALPEALGMDPVSFTLVLGPVFAAATLWLTFLLARRLGAPPVSAVVAVALLAVQPSFLRFCTGGMETGLVTTLVAAAAVLACGPLGTGSLALLSTVAAAAVMSRPDAVLLVGPACAAALLRTLSVDSRSRRVSALLAPGSALVVAWVAFKLAYYGEVLPNTFTAKTARDGAWSAGAGYLAAFVASTWMVVAPLAWVAAARGWLRDHARRTSVGLTVVLPVVLFAVYVAWVGGDFMEFRLLVPTFPLVFAGTMALMRRPYAPAWQTALVAIVLAAGSVHHAMRFRTTRTGVESVRDLTAHLEAPNQDWVDVGKRLRALFGGKSVRIAVSAAGAIPYYSGLPSLDMVGLSDPWIARNGIEISGQPGHVRAAPFHYLVEQGVNLVIAQPWVVTPRSPPERRPMKAGIKGFGFLFDVDRERIRKSWMLAIPLDEKRYLIVLYLTPHPAVERAAREGAWPSLDLSTIGTRSPERATRERKETEPDGLL